MSVRLYESSGLDGHCASYVCPTQFHCRGQDIVSDQSHKSYRPLTVLVFRLTRQAWSALPPAVTRAVAGESQPPAVPNSGVTGILYQVCFKRRLTISIAAPRFPPPQALPRSSPALHWQAAERHGPTITRGTLRGSTLCRFIWPTSFYMASSASLSSGAYACQVCGARAHRTSS